MDTALPYTETTHQPSELKKVVIGFAYKFAVEIIFFFAAAISVTVLWYLVFHCIDLNDHQNTYVYNPYELKYIIIVIGGVKRRVTVKRFYKKVVLGQ